jgi:uncharacterized membrane protein YiaA
MELNDKKTSFGTISGTILKILIISAFILLIGGSVLLMVGQISSANQTATRGFYLLVIAFVWRSVLYLRQRY